MTRLGLLLLLVFLSAALLAAARPAAAACERTAEPCLACGPEVERARHALADLSRRDRERLARGETSLRDHGRGAIGSIRIGAPPSRVWAVLTDFESWRNLFPDRDIAGLEHTDDGLVRVLQSTTQMGIEIRFTTLHCVDAAAGRVAFTLDPDAEADLERLRGAWQLVPADGGAATIVLLRSEVSSRHPVPGFLERRVTRTSVSDSLRALAAGVERGEGHLLAQVP